MLTQELGPFDIFEKIRGLSGVQYDDHHHVISYSSSNLFSCGACTSAWVAILLVLTSKVSWFRNALAISGLTMFIDMLHQNLPMLFMKEMKWPELPQELSSLLTPSQES